MKHASQKQFGAAKAVVPDVIEHGPDKWTLLQHLTDAAQVFDLSHRTLTVLKALLTFLPRRNIPDGPGAVVFPSNHTLSHRLSGMPESTLRRHLAHLVRAGIVSRQDSPNRKRFARHRAGQVACAYGFDLSPLAQMADTLAGHAATAREQRAGLAVLRCRVIDMRALVLAAEPDTELTDNAARLLRRKPDEGALQEMLDLLSKHLEALNTEETSGTDDHIERHIHVNPQYEPKGREPQLSLDLITHHCSAYRTFFPEKVRDWHDLFRITHQIAPMIGLDQATFERAGRVMGKPTLCAVVLCILERFKSIENPSAYLQSLITGAQRGVFRPVALLRGSATGNCQLTIQNNVIFQ